MASRRGTCSASSATRCRSGEGGRLVVRRPASVVERRTSNVERRTSNVERRTSNVEPIPILPRPASPPQVALGSGGWGSLDSGRSAGGSGPGGRGRRGSGSGGRGDTTGGTSGPIERRTRPGR
ncbi:hypothetical protein TsocGM_14255 [Tautonia sociabilis]|uniref:Uncharacterized protein n=1 Tax=Tautonia sociabilis TaxID=2080755 RepID=A0A432MIA9_9BACT|nr:hypothetical protein TsocGM_14255 [Tautonia sociabilis]